MSSFRLLAHTVQKSYILNFQQQRKRKNGARYIDAIAIWADKNTMKCGIMWYMAKVKNDLMEEIKVANDQRSHILNSNTFNFSLENQLCWPLNNMFKFIVFTVPLIDLSIILFIFSTAADVVVVVVAVALLIIISPNWEIKKKKNSA